ncbi:MAG: carboxypeptidase-like regulatory domain-containing protein, partial [Abditibacteriales bacterium]|nr:carboxypeptidase-like regulatory domain-containing protein [Abditibacteriales bacterium]
MPRGEVAYHLIATAAGYGIAWVTLKASEAESWFILPMTPAAQVRGRVVDAQGRPLAGVKVFVADLRPVEVDPSMSWLSFDEKTSPWWARTDRDGRFRIGGLPQDAQVGLRCASRLVRRDVTPFAVYASKSGDFGYVERAVEDEFTIILVPPAVIEGRVVSADTQQPAKGVNV